MPPIPKDARDPYPGRGANRDPKVATPRHPPSSNEARAPPGRIFTFETLPEKGIDYSRNHVRRLIKKGKFPPPFYLSERVPAWTERTLDQWISRVRSRARERRQRRTAGRTSRSGTSGCTRAACRRKTKRRSP